MPPETPYLPRPSACIWTEWDIDIVTDLPGSPIDLTRQEGLRIPDSIGQIMHHMLKIITSMPLMLESIESVRCILFDVSGVTHDTCVLLQISMRLRRTRIPLLYPNMGKLGRGKSIPSGREFGCQSAVSLVQHFLLDLVRCMGISRVFMYFSLTIRS